MTRPLLTRVPVTSELAYIEEVSRLPATFEARLTAEPDNRYFPGAVAVRSPGGARIGYLPVQAARHLHARLAEQQAGGVSCPARRHGPDHESPVNVLLDLSGLAELWTS